MADNTFNNDEYEFADLDIMGSESLDDDELSRSADAQTKKNTESSNTSYVKRNALIVIVGIILAIAIYKFVGLFTTTTTAAVESSATITPAVSTTPEVETPIVPVQTPVSQSSSVDTDNNQQLNQKLADLDANQQTIRADVSNATGQLNGMNSSLTSLNTKLDSMSQMMMALSAKIEQQNSQIAMLIAARTPPKPRPIVKRVVVPATAYYIQAVIPGRAWLIASNGSTLTVREGTNVSGYGIVKLIDPAQGRVVTSSGRVIRFSQQDS
ncbi:MAG: type IVB secretion system protein IcmG/DotF [Ignavibacteria bacterium]